MKKLSKGKRVPTNPPLPLVDMIGAKWIERLEENVKHTFVGDACAQKDNTVKGIDVVEIDV